MGFGFFGKVPQKGDYLAIDLPAKVLHPLEDWMSQAVVSSKLALGQQWQAAYLVAPIWRFWMPRSVFGLSCAGAMVSSVDSGGRYFPAAVLFVAGEREDISYPDSWDVDGWAAALDRWLFVMLRSDDAGYLVDLSRLPSPALAQQQAAVPAAWWRGDFKDADPIPFDGLPPPTAYAQMITGSVTA